MSLPPFYEPFTDDEEDRRRKAEIEEMMRLDRPRYFRDDAVQQEYRDILERQARAEEADTNSNIFTPRPFEETLAKFTQQRGFSGSNPDVWSKDDKTPLYDDVNNVQEKSISDSVLKASLLKPAEARPDVLWGPARVSAISLPDNRAEAMPDRYSRDGLEVFENSFGSDKQAQPAEGVELAQVRIVQNAPSSARTPINNKTPDGHTKHEGEIEVEKIPQLNAMIDRQAKTRGVNPRWLKIIAFLESGAGKKKDLPGAAYVGLFQFGKDAWKDFGQGGDRRNPEHSIRAAINEFVHNHRQFLKDVGREPTLTEMYMMHQQGYGGAINHLKYPDELAWKNMLATAEGRRKGKDGERWAKETIRGNLDEPLRSVAELMASRDFTGKWDRRMAGGTGYGTWFIASPSRP
jgi:hypothetical protein